MKLSPVSIFSQREDLRAENLHIGLSYVCAQLNRKRVQAKSKDYFYVQSFFSSLKMYFRIIHAKHLYYIAYRKLKKNIYASRYAFPHLYWCICVGVLLAYYIRNISKNAIFALLISCRTSKFSRLSPPHPYLTIHFPCKYSLAHFSRHA